MGNMTNAQASDRVSYINIAAALNLTVGWGFVKSTSKLTFHPFLLHYSFSLLCVSYKSGSMEREERRSSEVHVTHDNKVRDELGKK